MKRFGISIAVALVACKSGSPPPAPAAKTAEPDATKAATAPAASATPPELRLPTTVRPTHNTVELRIDPATEAFTGTIATRINVTSPTNVIWLNGLELELASAIVTVGGVPRSRP